jgi:hypothetical protein
MSTSISSGVFFSSEEESILYEEVDSAWKYRYSILRIPYAVLFDVTSRHLHCGTRLYGELAAVFLPLSLSLATYLRSV